MNGEKQPAGQSFFNNKIFSQANNSNEPAGKTNASSSQISVPEISLPKGGGAIKSIDEKFKVNAVNGTSSFSIPLPVSPARQGFSPSLSLAYNSGSGNGPFGLGWSLDIPSITRKTDKGLPQYRDEIDSDIYMISGSEDLVPLLEQDQNKNWNIKEDTHSEGSTQYQVKRYRPRIEGSFARIERWTRLDGDIHWRVTMKDNVVSIYGKGSDARIADPGDAKRIFKWMLEFSYDDKGNCIQYKYKNENKINVAASCSEQHRLNGVATFTNLYIEQVLYGAKTPYDPSTGILPDFMFTTFFDYCEPGNSTPVELADNVNWPARADAFSDHHACFEIRTYRLCHRVLLFHHFDELGTDPYLVKCLDLGYQYEQDAALNLLSLVTSKGYKKATNGSYLTKSLPPMQFRYEDAGWNEEVKTITPDNLSNAPVGIDDQQYAWVDLYSEGISGILSEQGNAWWYKENLGGGEFTNGLVVASKPSLDGLNNAVHIQELEADGRKFLVTQSQQLAGFFEMQENNEWKPFQSFKKIPNLDLTDPRVKFIDLNGDGKADLFINEDYAFCWYASKGIIGYDDYQQQSKEFDEDKEPVIAYADATETIMLSDINGDGLTDIVRLRNGEVVYWPNQGYGKFGSKVVMDNSPLVDSLTGWNPRYVRLTDINGTGTPDLIYLGKNCFQVWYNQNGNGWSEVKEITNFPELNNSAHVTTVDLLANGTSCIVWSSSLPADANSQMKYIDLMNGKKPFVMTAYENNLGKKVSIQYKPSSYYYLNDKKEGKPWVTKLPFPVQCVEKVVVEDKWRKSRFATTYSYHHGYFDYAEREFRGFGRIDQVDVESFDQFLAGNVSSPYITNDKTLYQPPIKTITWLHTGAWHLRQQILKQFENEYFPNSLPQGLAIDSVFSEKNLPEPDLNNESLAPGEFREALRACKGMMLRQESYELDVDKLETGVEEPVRLFSASTHNCHIKKIQPKEDNAHAVFIVTESEAISYQYELDFKTAKEKQEQLKPDPRIAHSLNLSFDVYGNIQQAITVGYPRIRAHEDADLTADQLGLINKVQSEIHLAYTETLYTKDIDDKYDPTDAAKTLNYRLRVPYELHTYELSGIGKGSNFYFDFEKLSYLQLSDAYAAIAPPIGDNEDYSLTKLEYHEQAQVTTATNNKHMRIVEHVRTLFFKNDLSGALSLGEHGNLGLVYEQFKLALTDKLLQAIFSNAQLNQLVPGGRTVQQIIDDPLVVGYLTGTDAINVFGASAAKQYWIRSGIAGFQVDAAAHFYLPERYTDPFNNATIVAYDGKYDLFIESAINSLGHTIKVDSYDYRILAATEIEDINENHTVCFYDILGLVVATALKGKGNEADDLSTYTDELANPTPQKLSTVFQANAIDEADLHAFLGNASMRYLYHFGEKLDSSGNIVGWCDRPAGACTILREKHVASLANGELSPLQVAFECSDGLGSVMMKKSRAEAEMNGDQLRWVVNGKTILNNKGNAVKQYEPYFTNLPACELEPQEVGVTSINYYDAVGRPMRTEMPDGSFVRVEFSPWYAKSFDANDTILEANNEWYASHSSATATQEEQRAAQLASNHAGTPGTMILDSLGRTVISIGHNRTLDAQNNLKDEKYFTYSKLDAEGKPLWVRDARGNLVIQFIQQQPPSPPKSINIEEPEIFTPAYDVAGNLLFQHSMDAGNRWMFNDATAHPLFAWDSRGNLLMSAYDSLHRPIKVYLLNAQHPNGVLVSLQQYDGDSSANDKLNNRLGKVYHAFDQSGMITNEHFDWKGNLLEAKRRVSLAYNDDVNWQDVVVDPNGDWSNTLLMPETFQLITEYDALNRMQLQYNWHKENSRVAVYHPTYNERGLLVKEDLTVGAIKSTNGATGGVFNTSIKNIKYDAKGQRLSIIYGNDIKTTYTYDPDTFRLQELVSRRQNNDLLQQLRYTYDPIGNIVEIEDKAIPTIFFNQFVIQPRNQYEYDCLYRLVYAQGREHAGQQVNYGNIDNWNDCPFKKIHAAQDVMNWRNYIQRYEYDVVGNILVMKHTAQGNTAASWTRQYQYALDSNRLLATGMGAAPADRYTDLATLQYTYDYNVHGSMTSMPHLQIMDLNFTEHLSHISRSPQSQTNDPDACNDSTLEAWYSYDGAKQRSRKRVSKQNNIVEERFYLGGLEWYRRWNNGNLVEEIESLHLFDGSQRLLMVDQILQTNRADLGTGTLYRYTLDNHLGSSCLELDETSAIISYEEYHPYGTTSYQAGRNASEVKLKRYRYTGMERDEESGFMYCGKRFDAPWIARWTSADPGGIIDGPNVYAYCSNNPVLSRDTSGTQGTPAKQVPTYDPNSGLAYDQWLSHLSREDQLAVKTLSESGGLKVGATQPLPEFHEKTNEDRWRDLEKQQKVTYNADLPPDQRITLNVMDNYDEAKGRANLREVNQTLDVTKGLAKETLELSVEALILELGIEVLGIILKAGGEFLLKSLFEGASKELTPLGKEALEAYESGAINAEEGKFFSQRHGSGGRIAAQTRDALGMPTVPNPSPGLSNFESAHMVGQDIGKEIEGYSASKAETINLPTSVHGAFDEGWVHEWQGWKASGRKATAKDVQLLLENAIDSIPQGMMSGPARANIKDRIAKELYETLGLSPESVILKAKPKPGPTMTINLSPL